MYKVYAVAFWDIYYPTENNVVKVFSDDRDAYQYLQEVRAEHRERG